MQIPWHAEKLSLAVTISLLVLTTPLSAADRTELRKAVQRSIPLLQLSAAEYTDQRDCFSCHHQALTSMAAALASQRGLSVDRKKVEWQSEFTAEFFLARKDQLAQGQGVPGGPYTAAYAALQLAADRAEEGVTRKLLSSYLLATADKQGGWRIGTHRPPIEDSDFTATALAVAALRLNVEASQSQQLAGLLRDSTRWLVQQPADTTEDRVFQLLGLYWSQLPGDASTELGWQQLFSAASLSWSEQAEDVFRRQADELIRRQQDDGGWSQLDGGESDAYATGQALVTLLGTGQLRPAQRVVRRGLDYLLSTQLADGSWYVKSRSKAFQKQFESGFPHGKDQFVSIAASSWATMAITLALPIRSVRSRSVSIRSEQRGKRAKGAD